MTKTLKVIKPFFVMEEGDTFNRIDNGNYVSEVNNEYNLANDLFDDSNDFRSTYNSRFEISEDYAKALVKLGHLEEVNENFVNVFDEIEKLAKIYDTELDNLDKDFENAPACMKVEKETVLKNMLKVLEHLHSLKK